MISLKKSVCNSCRFRKELPNGKWVCELTGIKFDAKHGAYRCLFLEDDIVKFTRDLVRFLQRRKTVTLDTLVHYFPMPKGWLKGILNRLQQVGAIEKLDDEKYKFVKRVQKKDLMQVVAHVEKLKVKLNSRVISISQREGW